MKSFRCLRIASAHFAPSFVEPNGRSFLRSSGSAFLAAAAAAVPVGSVFAAAGPLRFGRVCL